MTVSARIKHKQDQASAINKVLVSDGAISFQQDSKRTVKFHFRRTSQKQWKAEVISPFHSRYYGACCQSSSKARALQGLKDNLVRDFGYFGKVLLTTLGDDADNVGVINPRLLSDNAMAFPITRHDACGSAGQ